MNAAGSWAHASELAEVVGEHRVVVVDLDHVDDPPVILTDSAAAIWQAVDGAHDDEGVVRVVADEYGVDPTEIRQQVVGFLRQLFTRHLIVPA